MTIYPAIDLRNGRCVRLFQGKADQETIYFEDPSEPARKWREQGADHLHAVDLDGAFSGSSANLDAVRSILEVDGLFKETTSSVLEITSVVAGQLIKFKIKSLATFLPVARDFYFFLILYYIN